MQTAPRTIDEPIRIFGLTPEQFFGGLFFFLVFYLNDKPLLGIPFAVAFIVTYGMLTKGKDGALVHTLYTLGMQFPGFLPSYIEHFEE